MNKGWDNRFEWCFSNLGTGTKVGINDAGIGIFQSMPYKSLAKEILQNVIDAKNPDLEDKPARAVFKLIEIDREDFPGGEYLLDVIGKCSDYYSEGDDGEKLRNLKKDAVKFLNKSEKIPVLKISDYNTNGLLGVEKEKGSNWTGLVREMSATNKGDDKSGSFGVGKFAPFIFSSLRTIIYSTLNKKDERAIQGKAILTSFKEDNKMKQNTGLFGLYDAEKDDCYAVREESQIPEVFKRTEYGTDIFVTGFKCDREDWKDEIAISVLEYFFYTVYMGDLEVVIEDENESITIKKSNLDRLMKKYEEICIKEDREFTAPMYWEVLNSDEKKEFRIDIKGKGSCKLYLLADKKFTDRRVLEMRKPGMKIQEDTAFRIGINFHGILIADGEGSISSKPEDNINSFLRRCEDQSHSRWSPSEYKDNEKEAKRILKKIHDEIRDYAKSMMPKDDRKKVDAFGLSEYLPAVDEGDDKEEAEAFANFTPVIDEIKGRKKRQKVKKKAKTKSDKKKNGDTITIVKKSDDGEIISVKDGGVYTPGDDIGTGTDGGNGEEPGNNGGSTGGSGGSGGSHGSGDSGKPGDSVNTFEADKNGENEVMGNKKDIDVKILKKISLNSIKTPYNTADNSYRIIFTPESGKKNSYIRLRVDSDDSQKYDVNIKSAEYNGRKLEVNNNLITGLELKKGVKTVINVKLDDSSRKTLEVSAYV